MFRKLYLAVRHELEVIMVKRFLQQQGGVPEAIRTPDLHLRRVPLYPAELQGRKDEMQFLLKPSFCQ